MLFGKSTREQAQNAQDASGYAPSGENAGYPASGAQSSPWTNGGGYPTQQAGTGYAGYTPGAQNQAGYGTWGQAGQYGQAWGQTGQNYAPQGTGQAGQYGQAWSQTGQNYAQQNYGQTGQTYAPQGWSQAGQSYGQQPYGQAGQSYAQQPYAQTGAPAGSDYYAGQSYGQAQGYAQPQGYAQSRSGYAYSQAGTPQGQQGYGAGYNAYAQMGRNQQPAPDYSRQIPLNGGGYVPPPVPVRKQPFIFKDWMLILLGAVLAALFAVGLFAHVSALLWVFIVLAAGSAAFFWVKPVVSGSRRLCYSIVLGALCLVSVFSLIQNGAQQPGTQGGPTAVTAAPANGNSAGSGTVIDPETGNVISSVTEAPATPTPTPEVEDNSAIDRLESFFRYWSANREDEMLALCAPSWKSGVDNPNTALFGLKANRTPLDFTVEKISGTNDDTSRTVTLSSTMDRNNGKDPVKYRLNVIMVKESGEWYVDPASLKTYEEAETPDPALAETATPSPEPAVDANTVLYYNPDGGSMYHLDQNCKSTHAKYLPLKGHFTFAEVNDPNYAKLSPCNVCGAPLRP